MSDDADSTRIILAAKLMAARNLGYRDLAPTAVKQRIEAGREWQQWLPYARLVVAGLDEFDRRALPA